MPAKTDVWMPVYIGDLLGDTMHLTPAEFGAYHLIMYHQWRNGPIPPRSLRSVTRMSAEEWADSESTLKAFLTVDADGLFYQRRVSIEKEKSDKNAEIARANGLKGGRPKTQTEPTTKPKHNPAGNPDHNPDGTQNVTPSPSPSPSTTESTNTIASTSSEVPAADRGKIVGKIPLNDGSEFEIYEMDVAEWREAFPALDVKQECIRAKQWLVDNPANRKTRKGIRRYLNSWLSRAQNSAPRVPVVTKAADVPSAIDVMRAQKAEALAMIERENGSA